MSARLIQAVMVDGRIVDADTAATDELRAAIPAEFWEDNTSSGDVPADQPGSGDGFEQRVAAEVQTRLAEIVKDLEERVEAEVQRRVAATTGDQQAGGASPAPQSETDPAAATPSFDPAQHNVDEVLEHLKDASADEQKRVLAAEVDGKGRSTVLAFKPAAPEGD